jgi:hypothetical protein
VRIVPGHRIHVSGILIAVALALIAPTQRQEIVFVRVASSADHSTSSAYGCARG